MLPQANILYFYSYNGIPFIHPEQKGMKIDEYIVKDICKTLYGKAATGPEQRAGDLNDHQEINNRTKLRYPNLQFNLPFTLNSTNLLETRPIIGQIINS